MSSLLLRGRGGLRGGGGRLGLLRLLGSLFRAELYAARLGRREALGLGLGVELCGTDAVAGLPSRDARTLARRGIASTAS